METPKMNTLTLISYHSSMDSWLMEYLGELEFNQFTKWTEVKGQGRHSEPHLDNHVWPGTNNVLAIMCDEMEREVLYKVVRHLREHAPGEGIKAFTLPIMDYT